MKHLVKIALSLLLTPYLQADVVEHTVSIQLKMHVEGIPYSAGNHSIKKITPHSVSTGDVIEHLCANQGKPFSSSMRLIRKTILDEDGNVISQGYFVRDKFQSDQDVSSLISWDIERIMTKSRIHSVTKLGTFSDIQLQTLGFDLDRPITTPTDVHFNLSLNGYATSKGRIFAPPLKEAMRVWLYSETMVCRGRGALHLKKFTSTSSDYFVEGTIRHSAPSYVRTPNSESN